MNDNSLMPFGKHKNNQMKNVPATYLRFIYDNNMMGNPNNGLKEYIEDNLDVIDKEIKEQN